jgi:hypothetical protein
MFEPECWPGIGAATATMAMAISANAETDPDYVALHPGYRTFVNRSSDGAQRNPGWRRQQTQQRNAATRCNEPGLRFAPSGLRFFGRQLRNPGASWPVRATYSV